MKAKNLEATIVMRSATVAVTLYVAVTFAIVACTPEQKALGRAAVSAGDALICVAAQQSGNAAAGDICTTADRLAPVLSQLLQAKAKRAEAAAAAADAGVKTSLESRACVDMSFVDGLAVEQNGR